MEAQAAGMAAMWAGAGQNVEMVKFFMAVDTGLFRDLASKTAQAVQGMQPKINIWNTGAGGEVLANPRAQDNIAHVCCRN
jgi:flotillin